MVMVDLMMRTEIHARGAVQTGDDFLVRGERDAEPLQRALEPIAIAVNSRRVFLVDEGELLIHMDDGVNVLAGVEARKHLFDGGLLAYAGDDGFDSRAGLQRIGGVGDHNPIAVAKQRQPLVEEFFHDTGFMRPPPVRKTYRTAYN